LLYQKLALFPGKLLLFAYSRHSAGKPVLFFRCALCARENVLVMGRYYGAHAWHKTISLVGTKAHEHSKNAFFHIYYPFSVILGVKSGISLWNYMKLFSWCLVK